MFDYFTLYFLKIDIYCIFDFNFAETIKKPQRLEVNRMQSKRKYVFFFSTLILLVFFLYLSFNMHQIEQYISNTKIISVVSSNDTNKDKKTEESSTSTTNPSGDDMVKLLARLINGEARGEPFEGQVAVGAVIMNRVKSPKFPNTIAGVIYQKGQFSCVTDGQFNAKIEKDSTVYKAAQEAMNGSDPTNGALYFFNPSKTKSKWLFSLPVVATIGEHKFSLGEAEK